jgi:hypothetical protein
MARKSGQTTKTSTSEVRALLERIRERSLSDSDMMLLERVVTLFLSLLMKIEQKKPSIEQLRIFLFGKPPNSSEANEQNDGEQAQAESKQPAQAASGEPKPKRKGHGRRSASACTGAKVVFCQQEELQVRCDDCGAEMILWKIGVQAMV